MIVWIQYLIAVLLLAAAASEATKRIDDANRRALVLFWVSMTYIAAVLSILILNDSASPRTEFYQMVTACIIGTLILLAAHSKL